MSNFLLKDRLVGKDGVLITLLSREKIFSKIKDIFFEEYEGVRYLSFQKIAQSVENEDGEYLLVVNNVIEVILSKDYDVDSGLEILNLMIWTFYMELQKLALHKNAFETVMSENVIVVVRNINLDVLLSEIFLLEEFFETYTLDSLPKKGIDLEAFESSFLGLFYTFQELSSRGELVRYNVTSIVGKYILDILKIAESRGEKPILNLNIVIHDIKKRMEVSSTKKS